MTSTTSLFGVPSNTDDESHHVPDILGTLLKEQASPSAVEIFSDWHEDNKHRQGPMYSALIPAEPLSPGEQYAFEVDLDACTACKACVTACHSLNGLEDDETWRRVGNLHGGTIEAPYRQPVTTACHHCVEPSCLSGCPVDAYRKDPLTGVVEHLDDQCIGCRYCIFTCPYEVPKFNPRKGIVRKCDMCQGRLSHGEAPACVQGCPNDAIRIAKVKKADIVEEAATHSLLPGVPSSQLSLPSTRYLTERVMPRNTRAVDFSEVPLKESHPSLVIMLVFTQLSVGAFITHAWSTPNFGSVSTPAVALLFAVVALLSSVGHLGRPQYAFRALIGLTHSWLSREILAFGIFFGVASVYVLLVFIGDDSIISDAARYGVTGVGLAAILTSAMIYIRTGRPGWASLLTAAKFLLTSVWLGVLSSLAIRVILQNPQGTTLLLSITMVAAAFKLAIELSALVALSSSVESPFRQRASALVGPLRTLWLTRLGFGFWGGLIGPFLFFEHLPVWGVLSIWLLAVGGEFIERHLFFVASVAPRMPGDLA